MARPPSKTLSGREPMSFIVKICGLQTEEGLDAALACGAEMVGFVCFEKSPRHVSLERAAALGERAGTKACKVLLTVDAADEELAAAIAALRPSLLQLHGSETPERIAAVRRRFGLPVMKAIGLKTAADLGMIPSFEGAADLLLFDAKPPPESRRPGGNGQCFDWSLLAEAPLKKPWLLAGGLNSANVAQAVSKARAQGVDVSSGVESAPGVKDGNMIAAFIAEARAAAGRLGAARPKG